MLTLNARYAVSFVGHQIQSSPPPHSPPQGPNSRARRLFCEPFGIVCPANAGPHLGAGTAGHLSAPRCSSARMDRHTEKRRSERAFARSPTPALLLFFVFHLRGVLLSGSDHGDMIKSMVYGGMDGIIPSFAIVCAASAAKKDNPTIVTLVSC